MISYFDKIQSIDCNDAPAYQPIDVPREVQEGCREEVRQREGLKKDAVLNDDYIRGPKL